jgi:hypothetical protein
MQNQREIVVGRKIYILEFWSLYEGLTMYYVYSSKKRAKAAENLFKQSPEDIVYYIKEVIPQ